MKSRLMDNFLEEKKPTPRSVIRSFPLISCSGESRRRVINELTGAASGAPTHPVVRETAWLTKGEKERK